KVSMYEVAGTGTPLWEYTITPNFYLPVAASDDNAVVASIGDIVPLNAWLSGAGPTPSWSYNPPVGWKGSDCDVSDNGMYIVASYKEDGTDNGKLLVFASTGGAPLWEIDFNAQNGINGIEISEDNNWIVISTYYAYHVFDFTNLLLFASVTNYSQTTGGIDDDAEYLATGDFYGQLHLYQRTGTGYTQLWQSYMGGWVTAVDVSSDASMVIAGNYTYSPSNAGEVRGYDIGGTQLWSYAQYGDYIADAALCNDGSVGVATSWGALNYTFGDIFTAFDMPTGDVIFNLLDDIDEPGTLFDVAISDDGTIAVSGGKAVHARTFGNGGQIYAIELGGGVSPMTLDLTYVSGSPVPAGGGNVDYEIYAENVGTSAIDFDGWLEVSFEGGAPTTVAQRNFIGYQPGWTINRPDMFFPVPSTYAAGNYTFAAKIGTYPDDPWVEDSFPFVKSGAADGSAFVPFVPAGTPNPFDRVVKSNSGEACLAPTEFVLLGNYPNPFNPTTAISYELRVAGSVLLNVFDIQGREVARLVNGWRDAGTHDVTFDASSLTSGVYLYRLTTEAQTVTGKMVLMK
ncbi:T9SS type A sorting domain-containing protein, partial [bacterium]|nr:T9SS type A sorting domain-containing protein [bacterium]